MHPHLTRHNSPLVGVGCMPFVVGRNLLRVGCMYLARILMVNVHSICKLSSVANFDHLCVCTVWEMDVRWAGIPDVVLTLMPKTHFRVNKQRVGMLCKRAPLHWCIVCAYTRIQLYTCMYSPAPSFMRLHTLTQLVCLSSQSWISHHQ